MNSMLERESKTDAVKKKTDRSKKVVEDVPPTTPGKKAHIQFLCLLFAYANADTMQSCRNFAHYFM